ncbi:putative baseplate assembly protein [Tahibacter sp. UC22_41]|uniref:putative baseplate assembly protein n=1 Tax=Tahibacter sp. UC22_41 TaxID=3350178 RepID=UPI0036DA1468
MSCECGCCSGVHVATPAPVANRPGLSQIAHRPGDWGTYFASMQAKLSSARFPELAALKTRATDDASIALCDAWAVAAEVLSFYQDRIANEGYLRTATERRSLIELGRLTGYELRPGVSASVYLSYELDANAGRVTIPPGTRAQSVPGAGEKMQTFETAEALDARADWSRVTVRQSRPAWRSSEDAHADYGVLRRGLTFAGTATQLKPNDALLVDYGGIPKPYRIAAVTVDDVAQTTHVRVRAWNDTASALAQGGPPPRLGGRELVEGLNRALNRQPRDATRVPRSSAATLRPGGEIYSRILTNRTAALRDMLLPALSSFDAAGAQLGPIRVYALRTKAGVYGSAAPNLVLTAIAGNTPTYNKLKPRYAWADLPEVRTAVDGGHVPAETKLTELPLDGVYDAIKPGDAAAPSWVIVDMPASNSDPTLSPFVFSLAANRSATLTVGAAISAKASILKTNGAWCTLPLAALDTTDPAFTTLLRLAQVHAQSELLPLARDPLVEAVEQLDEIELDGYYDSFAPGMWLIAAGDRDDIPDPKLKVPAAERAMIASVRHDVVRVPSDAGGFGGSPLPGDTLHTFVRLATPLAYSYRRATFALHGNVVRATHGETRRETLGGGDASQAFQRFTLKSPPLTYVSAPTTSGVASTLTVRVNRLRWHETADLPTSPPDARAYATSRDDAEATSVRFGDGVHGARLPSGPDNVTAVYRTGLGSAGNVRASQIALPTDKPLGVKGVTNPLRASGGAEPDTLRQARENAPLAVTALDRLVSVKDYEDFARTYAGIGKAVATTLRDGRRAVVHVTIAGIDDEPIDETSDLFLNLQTSLRTYGDPHQPVRVQVRDALSLMVEAHIAIEPDYEWADVQPRVRAALLERFGFAAAQLAQPVIVSRMLAAIEAVRGVDHVDSLKVRALDDAALIAGIDPVAPPPDDDDDDGDEKHNGGIVTTPPKLAALPWIPVDGASVAGIDAYKAAQIAYLPSDVPDTLILELAS